jgi:hypothetical protein
MATTPGPAAASVNSENFDAVHRKLLTDPSLQFQFEKAEPPSKPPDWLRELLEMLGHVFGFLAPFLEYIFWGGVVVVVGLIAYAILTEVLRRLPSGDGPQAEPLDLPEPEFHPAAERARALLEEADRLAREGRFAEAVRILLHRSIEDMEQAFPSAIMPSMTSREISTLRHLSTQGRETFVKIARAVEASLFGGRPLTADNFAECRAAYQSFAFQAPAA